MTPTIELIYFEGCPNVERARTNIGEALVALDLTAEWQEWEQGDPGVPEYVKQHGSPTVLVNGRDVTGVETGVGGAACRADGAPSADVIRAALEEAV
jgi:hypothetical protein